MKAESKRRIDAKLFQCPDCGQVLGPVTPAQLQGDSLAVSCVVLSSTSPSFGIAGDTTERIAQHQTPPA